MSNFLTKILGDKNEWKSMEARADALPRDYRIVYAEIMQHRLRGTRSHVDKWRESLNRDVLRQLGHARPQD